MKSQRKKLVMTMCMMTIFYTSIFIYFIPGPQSVILFNKIARLVEDVEHEFSLVFNHNSQEQRSPSDLKTSSTKITKKEEESGPTYVIKAALNEESYKINGQMNVTIDNPGTDSILFYSYPYSSSSMRIKKVLINEQEVTFSYDQQQLIIKNLKKEKELHVFIEFETPIPRKGTRFGYKDDVWLITTWYPMLGVLDDSQNWIERPDPIGMGDPFLFNYANYVVEWTSSPSIKWLSSGTLLSETMVNGKRKTTWEVNGVRNFALAGSKNYKIKKLQFDDTTVSIALTEEINFEQVMNIAKFSFPLFGSRYGQLPYSDVAIIETSYDTNFALEYPNLAVFSKDMYSDNQIEHWLPHEIGHMWWYNAVGVNEVKSGWIDEGLAELGVVLYLENRYSKSEGEKLRNRYRKRNQSLTNRSLQKTMDVGLYGFKSKQEFYDSWYARSADMFLTLRDEIGEEKFNSFLRTLYTMNIGKTMSEESIVKALDESLSLKTDLFQNWLHDPYHQTKWDVKVTDSFKK